MHRCPGAREPPPPRRAGRLALGLAHDRQLDLGRLDAEAADLDLGIGAAEPDDLAVAEDATEVAGAVEPGAGAPGMFDEALGGEFGARW
ncbi:hypothetical protein P4131_04405 [Pseudomonas aeruginosa]|nr:hypothetical protein [Pseudomonas aeruginosa]